MHDPSGFLEVTPASFNKVKLGCENSTTTRSWQTSTPLPHCQWQVIRCELPCLVQPHQIRRFELNVISCARRATAAQE